MYYTRATFITRICEPFVLGRIGASVGSRKKGNACRILLREHERLNDPEIYQNVGKLRLLPFINFFKAMNQLVSQCFSTKRVTIGIESLLKNLKIHFEATEVSETLKIHVLFEHLQQCLECLNHDGLEVWSEQAA